MSPKYRKLLLLGCTSVLASALVILPNAGHAGFEWTAPESAKTNIVIKEDSVDNTIVNTGMPLIPTEKEGRRAEEVIQDTPDVIARAEIKEEIIEEKQSPEIDLFPLDKKGTGPLPDISVPVVLSDAALEDVGAGSTAEQKKPETAGTGKNSIAWNEQEDFSVIEGFGSEVPLALALRQIVPAHYAFSFGEDVNPGASLSWQGGKPWNKVLEEALSPLDVKFDVKQRKLSLYRGSEKTAQNTKAGTPLTSPQVINQQQEEITIPAEELETASIQDAVRDEIKTMEEKTGISRTSVLDPGRVETTQPQLPDLPEADLFEKKKRK